MTSRTSGMVETCECEKVEFCFRANANTAVTVGILFESKARPHQQQCRNNIVECYKLNDSFDKVECSFDIVAGVDGA